MTVILRPVPRFEKYPDEIIKQAVDFGAILDAGETVISGTATAKNKLDSSDATNIVLSGTPTVSGTTVVFQVTGGVAGTDYILSVSATLSSAEIYSQRIEMKVVDLP